MPLSAEPGRSDTKNGARKVGHEEPGLGAAIYVAFNEELVVRLFAGGDAYAEILCKLSQRRQLFTGRHISAGNLALYVAVELKVKGSFRVVWI